MNIGIDLGTFNSAAAVVLGRGEVVMVESKWGESLYGKSFPSFVSFSHEGEKVAVGKKAKVERTHNPKLVIWGVKRLVGLSYEKAKESGELKHFLYDIEKGTDGGILIKVGEKRFTPSYILECILGEIKEAAKSTQFNPLLGGEIEKAVVSVPAYFDGTRVGAIMEAAKNGGLGEIETIAEPTAAALAYIHSSRHSSQLKLKKESKILTFDLGAGTLDITVMLMLFEAGELNPGELCTSGHEALGGIDMDDMLMTYLRKKYGLSEIEDVERSAAMLKDEADFRDETEGAKIALSKRGTTELILPNKKPAELTREELEKFLKPLLEQCRGPIRTALRESGLKASDLDHVLFVGGPTYMPCVRATVMNELQTLGASKELLEELANWQHEELPVNPMECVAIGAALKAGGILESTTTSDPNGYGVIVYGNLFYPIIPVNSPYPTTMMTTIVYPHPEIRRVTIPLARKRAQDKAGRTDYEYVHLGDYDYYIHPTSEEPEIGITMTLDENGKLITTSEHRQRRESITFEKLNEYTGKVKELLEFSEETRRQRVREREVVAPSTIREWTREELDKAIHAARKIVDEFAEGCTDMKVTQKKKELLDLLEGPLDPQKQTHSVMNLMLELLNALSNAGVIKVDEFFDYMEELSKIERA